MSNICKNFGCDDGNRDQRIESIGFAWRFLLIQFKKGLLKYFFFLNGPNFASSSKISCVFFETIRHSPINNFNFMDLFLNSSQIQNSLTL